MSANGSPKIKKLTPAECAVVISIDILSKAVLCGSLQYYTKIYN